jgi:hypothetical protein
MSQSSLWVILEVYDIPDIDHPFQRHRKIQHTLSQVTQLSWLTDILTEELWKEEQFQRGDLSIQSVPGLQTVCHHLTDHIHTRKPHRQQPLSMFNLSSATHVNMQYMSPPKMRIHILQCLKDSMPHMSGDQHLDPRYSGN